MKMRSSAVILIFCLFIPVAWASDGKPGRVYTIQAAECPAPLSKEGAWIYNRGWGVGADGVTAKKSAMADARRRLEERIDKIAHLSKPEKGTWKSRINEWKEPHAFRRGDLWEACAVVYLRTDALDGLTRGSVKDFEEQLRVRIEEFVRKIGARAGPVLLRFVPPAWMNDGRAVESFGPALAAQILGELGRFPAIQVVDPTAKRWTVELSAMVSPRGDGCTLLLQHQGRRDAGVSTLPVFRFDARAFGEVECWPAPETYISDSRMGLINGRRIGSSGLRVELVSDAGRDGTLCEGELFSVTLTASEPAWFRVYSVADNGRVLMGWSSESALRRWTPKEGTIALRLPGEQRSRMVALAVPEKLGAGGFGSKVPPAGCFGRAGTGLDLARLPAEVAAATFTFAVVAPGKGDCPDSSEIRESVGRVLDVLESMKDCP